MDKSTRETIGYYDANAAGYVADTVGVEFGELQREFIRRLPEGGRVLDLGCGSGRDSLAFLKAGLAVDAVDGSVRMAEAAGAGSPTSTSPPCAPSSPRSPGSGSTASTSRATSAPAAPARSGSTPGA